MRLFVAIPLPKPLRFSLEGSVAEWREALPEARWTKPSDWHVTLRFLGEVPDDQLSEVKTWLHESLAGAQGGAFRFRRTGHFGRRERYVLWAGLSDAAWMEQLATRLNVVVCGCQPEEREFQPHVTLARIEVDRRNEAAFLGFMQTFDRAYLMPEVEEVKEVILYRSELTPSGPQYSVMDKCKLL